MPESVSRPAPRSPHFAAVGPGVPLAERVPPKVSGVRDSNPMRDSLVPSGNGYRSGLMRFNSSVNPNQNRQELQSPGNALLITSVPFGPKSDGTLTNSSDGEYDVYLDDNSDPICRFSTIDGYDTTTFAPKGQCKLFINGISFFKIRVTLVGSLTGNLSSANPGLLRVTAFANPIDVTFTK